MTLLSGEILLLGPLGDIRYCPAVLHGGFPKYGESFRTDGGFGMAGNQEVGHAEEGFGEQGPSVLTAGIIGGG